MGNHRLPVKACAENYPTSQVNLTKCKELVFMRGKPPEESITNMLSRYLEIRSHHVHFKHKRGITYIQKEIYTYRQSMI